MTIDAHQHFWKYDPVRDAWITPEMEAIRRDFFPADLKPLLQNSGIQGCVAVQADQSEAETNFLLDLAKAQDWIKGVVGWVDLCDPQVEARLEHYAQEPLIKGFRHIVQGEPDPNFMDRSDFRRGIAALSKFGFTYDILIFPHQLPAACRLVHDFPNQAFVVDHLAKPYINAGKIDEWAGYMRHLARYQNCCCKISGMITEADWFFWTYAHLEPYMEQVLEGFSPHRLMFGSDWPVCQVAGEYDQVVDIVRRFIAPLDQEAQNLIMGGTAQLFYKL